MTKIRSLDELTRECARLRAAGVRIVATGGCFDLLHLGHVRSLQTARSMGDCLVVMINSDASIHALKGPGRPIVPEQERMEILAALACVNYVTLFDGDSPAPVLAALQPHIFCKGADYAPGSGKPLPHAEVEAVNAYGGEIAFLPLIPGNSTTSVIERIHSR
jgi:rfaE bifunctional protein nucleotidyltransferase chain/domain